MLGNTIKVCAVVVLVMFWLAAVPRAMAQRDYESESKSWKFTCPEGWNPIAFDIIKQHDLMNHGDAADRNFSYIAGFTRGPMNTFVYPFIVICKTTVDLGSASLNDIEEALTISDPQDGREAALAELVAGLAQDRTSLDRVRLRLVGTFSDTDEQGKEINGTVYTYLGSKNVIQFECYDLAENGSKNAGLVQEFVDSFKFRQDAQFVPAEGTTKYDKSQWRSAQRRSSSSSGFRFGRYSMYGGGGGVLIAIIVLRLVLGSSR